MLSGKAVRHTNLTTPPDEPSNDVPTRKDLETVDAFIRLSKQQKGRSPTMRAIAIDLGISQGAVKERLKQCHAKRLLHRPVVQVLGPYEITKEAEKWLAMAG